MLYLKIPVVLCWIKNYHCFRPQKPSSQSPCAMFLTAGQPGTCFSVRSSHAFVSQGILAQCSSNPCCLDTCHLPFRPAVYVGQDRGRTPNRELKPVAELDFVPLWEVLWCKGRGAYGNLSAQLVCEQSGGSRCFHAQVRIGNLNSTSNIVPKNHKLLFHNFPFGQ